MRLVDCEAAAVYAGRPVSTIRRWRSEGRVTRHGEGRGNVVIDLDELPHATRDETGALVVPPPPPLPAAA